MTGERPAYGQRLMPSALDDLAKRSPKTLFASIPRTSDVTQGFRDITAADFARCVNFTAKWLENKFGRSNDFETIAYVGIADLRGSVIVLAAVKCGYKALLPSPRNPPATTLSLMGQTGSTKLLNSSELAPVVKKILSQETTVRNETVPSFDEMLNSTVEHYPYDKEFSEAKDDPVVVLHSSGSTGLPKPIVMTHSSFAALDNEHNFPEIPGRKQRNWSMWKFDEPDSRMYTVFPFFHIGGFVFHTVAPIFNNLALVLGPPNLLPDGQLLKNVMLHQKLRTMLLPPTVIEQFLNEPGSIELLKTLDFLAYSGAPLNPDLGDMLSKVVELHSPYGSTETCVLPEMAPSREDWLWHEFSPYLKHEMQHFDETEDIYELVILADPSNMVYYNLPGVSEHRTKDLFARHPEKHNLFKYYGRRDDIIVLANGEKFNPVPVEVSIQNHPALKGSLVIGNGRSQSALLVEPKEPLDESGRARLLDELWPYIEKSNSLVGGPGRIHPGRVLCAVPGKPFSRTGKGTTIRKLTEEAYKEEIENIYSGTLRQRAVGGMGLKLTPKLIYEQATIVKFLRGIISTFLPLASTISDHEDFFSHGLDSVQTLEVVSNLKHNLQEQTAHAVGWITPRVIFRHPTLDALSALLKAFLEDGTVPQQDTDRWRAREVDDTVARHVEGLPQRSAPRGTVRAERPTVAVIGSTGYLGSHLVAKLLKNESISRVYCLNRSEDAQKRQETSLVELDDSLSPLLGKLEYLTIELGQSHLGLTAGAYEKLANEVDVMVYNSWRLDFGLAISSFEPFLRAACDLVQLSTESKRNMHVVFVSSTSSVVMLSARGATVPEEVVNSPLAAFNTGYGQSKQAAERILAAGSQISKVPVSIVRVGQVGGPADAQGGKWADQPWISALLRTAKTLKSVPARVTPIDWVPVDSIVSMLQSFMLTPAESDNLTQVYNIIHPRPQPWELLADILIEQYGVTDKVPLKDWVQRLRDMQDPTADDIARLPALKLLDFYEGIGEGAETLTITTERATNTSLIEIPTIDKELLESWLRSWDL